MAGRRRATLADVAVRAGVSLSTASLTFSGAGPVAEATRARVLAAATELGYAGPDPRASALRQGRSGVVGVVIGERLRYAFRDPAAVALLDGMSEELGPLGSALLLLPGDSRHTSPPPARVARIPLDAMVYAGCDDDHPLIDHALARGVPVVAVEAPRRPGLPMVDIDQRGGSREAATHLVDLGHRDLAVVSLPLGGGGGPADGGSAEAGARRGPVDPARRAQATFAVCRDRLAGVEEVLGPGTPVFESASNLVEEGELVGAMLLDGARRPTAVIAQSDLLAIGVIRAARRAALRVPADLSVIGFDGIDTTGWLGDERLTTVEQPMVEKGHATGRMVAELLTGNRPPDVKLPVTFRVGTTTGPAPRRRPE